MAQFSAQLFSARFSFRQKYISLSLVPCHICIYKWLHILMNPSFFIFCQKNWLARAMSSEKNEEWKRSRQTCRDIIYDSYVVDQSNCASQCWRIKLFSFIQYQKFSRTIGKNRYWGVCRLFWGFYAQLHSISMYFQNSKQQLCILMHHHVCSRQAKWMDAKKSRERGKKSLNDRFFSIFSRKWKNFLYCFDFCHMRRE